MYRKPCAAPVFLLLLIACGPYFYQAPPSLGTYPERIAAKRWQHLLAESLPPAPPMPDAAALDEVCRKLPETLAPLDTPKRLAEIDRLLAENRNGPYAVGRANFLHELRELAADPTLFESAKSYVEWRLANDQILPETDFEKLFVQSTPSLLPYWRIRRGATLFETGRLAGAAEDFSAVIDGFPDHPRAEVASLMQARCKIEQSRHYSFDRRLRGKIDHFNELLRDAETILNELIARHPHGRFTPDAEGWLGAIAYERILLGTAVKHQLVRLDLQPTREITRSVLRECDRIFEEVLESYEPDASGNEWLDPQRQFDAAAVARHPLAARLFVQHCVDPAAHISLPTWWDEGESGDRMTIDFLKSRILKPKPFVRLALAELCKELVIAKSKPDATTLTLLAWSATENGEHKQALALLGQIQSPKLSDETMHARAIILQRLDRHGDAVVAFDALAKDHPCSPLLNDLPYRRSISLLKSDRSGKAILEILPLANSTSSVLDEVGDDTSPLPKLHPRMHLIQWLDTLIQFAPLKELEIAFAGIKEDRERFDSLRDAIRTRALAAHRFDIAARYLDDSETSEESVEEIPDEDAEPEEFSLSEHLPMSRTEWNRRVAPLAKLYAQLNNTPPASKRAQLHLSIARHWMKNRGYLTMPSLALSDYSGSDGDQDLLRRRNAIELGFSRKTIHLELDHRDEVTHALEHALEAAVSKDPAIAAPALELANECLFRRAEFSLYQKSRALETGASKFSSDLHRQLCERFPKSPEAKRSVYYTFTPTAGPWMPANGAASTLNGATADPSQFDPPGDSDVMKKIRAIPSRIGALDRTTPLAEIHHELDATKREMDALRQKTSPTEQAGVVRVIQILGDLQDAVSLPGISADDFLSYANGKNDILPPVFTSLLEFRKRLSRTTEEVPYPEGTDKYGVPGWSTFLALYPDSPKAEEASFYFTTMIARRYRTMRDISDVYFPEAPSLAGYKHFVVYRQNPAIGPDEVLAAIDEHEKQYPRGRYQVDLNLLRAGALIDAGKFPQALALLESILSNPVQCEFFRHGVAAFDFADIAQRLLDLEQRALIASAFRDTPGALDRLRLLVNGDTFLSQLKPLMPWLEEGR